VKYLYLVGVPKMLQGWKAIHEHVCKFTGRLLSFDTVRKWGWLDPALEYLNDRVAARTDNLESIISARIRPSSAA
jgi:hypothetical protein